MDSEDMVSAVAVAEFKFEHLRYHFLPGKSDFILLSLNARWSKVSQV